MREDGELTKKADDGMKNISLTASQILRFLRFNEKRMLN